MEVRLKRDNNNETMRRVQLKSSEFLSNRHSPVHFVNKQSCYGLNLILESSRITPLKKTIVLIMSAV